MLEAIRKAESSIHLETFIFSNDSIGKEFVAALTERAAAGVKVRLLLDAIGSSDFGEENEKQIEAAGGKVEFVKEIKLNDLRKVHLRTHRKVLIIDGKLAYTGGICIDDAWRGNGDSPERWRETMLEVAGPVVRQIQVAYARAWFESTGELLSERALYPPLAAEGTLVCQLADVSPDRAQSHGAPAFPGGAGQHAIRDLDHQQLFRARPGDPPRHVAGGAARRSSAAPPARSQHRLRGGAPRRAALLRRSARGGCGDLRVPARAAARQDPGRRRALGERRLDQPRPPLAGLELRVEPEHLRRGLRHRDGNDVRARSLEIETAHAWRSGRSARSPNAGKSFSTASQTGSIEPCSTSSPRNPSSPTWTASSA